MKRRFYLLGVFAVSIFAVAALFISCIGVEGSLDEPPPYAGLVPTGNNTISIVAGSGAEGTDASGSVTFTVTLGSEATSASEVSFDYVTELITEGDNLAEEDDFVAGTTGQNLVISSGNVAVVSIAVKADNLYEGDETFNLVISSIVGATLAQGASTTVVGTIANDDELPELSLANASKTEGTGNLVFVARINKPAAEDISFSYATSIDTNTADTADQSDFDAIPLTSGTITKGGTIAEIAVTINDDADSEHDIFTLTLSELATGAIFAGAGSTLTAKGTIVDDEATSGSNTIIIAVGSGDEGTSANGLITFAVTLSSAASATEIVSFEYAAELATTGDNLADVDDLAEIATRNMAISSGSEATITIIANADNLSEEDEIFNLVISNIVGATSAQGASVTVVGTITNDDISQ